MGFCPRKTFLITPTGHQAMRSRLVPLGRLRMEVHLLLRRDYIVCTASLPASAATVSNTVRSCSLNRSRLNSLSANARAA